MKIDLKHYRNIMPTVISVCQNNTGKSHKELVSCIAVASYAPAIVSCYYYAKHIGYMPDEVQETITNLISFYKYTEIIGKDEA